MSFGWTTMLEDHDFHPDEPTVRVFVTPQASVLRLDDDVAVIQVDYDGVVLRHYAFADKWFKVNVTTNVRGELVETGDAGTRFALNCDIATPMERDGNSIFAVDLFTDVLVAQDVRRYRVTDQDEMTDAEDQGLISRREVREAERGLAELVELVERDRLFAWLHDVHPFGPCDPPAALPMQRRPVPTRLSPRTRRTW